MRTTAPRTRTMRTTRTGTRTTTSPTRRRDEDEPDEDGDEDEDEPDEDKTTTGTRTTGPTRTTDHRTTTTPTTRRRARLRPRQERADLEDIGSAYPGDDATQQQVARWMAAEAQRRGLPPELPVMAALVESGMRNLSGGDADSVGFFQMRVGHLEQRRVRGLRRPARAAARLVPRPREGRRAQRVGARPAGRRPDRYGEWIADVERPAEQYRGRYQLRLDEAASCWTRRPARARGGPSTAPERRAAPVPARARRWPRRAVSRHSRIAGAARRRRPASTAPAWSSGPTPRPASGSRASRDQQILAAGATKVSRNASAARRPRLLPRLDAATCTTSGCRSAAKRFLHAPHTGDVVKVSSLDEPYYAAAVHRRTPLRPGSRHLRVTRARARAPPRPRRRRGHTPGTACQAIEAQDGARAQRRRSCPRSGPTR